MYVLAKTLEYTLSIISNDNLNLSQIKNQIRLTQDRRHELSE